MFEVTIRATFCAAHQVRGYPGDCADIHGHSYRVEVSLKRAALDRLGLAIDFRKARAHLGSVVGKLDHKRLNVLPFFKKHNATAEWIAVFIYQEMKKKLPATDRVTVWEGFENSVTYAP